MAINIIFQEDIESVPILNVSYFNKKLRSRLHYFCKYCLFYSMLHNNSKECAILLNSADLSKYEEFIGSEKNVCIKSNKMMTEDNGDDYRFILIHNHPSNSGFSDKDIRTFLKSYRIGCAIAVQNNGTLHMLLKTSTPLGITSKEFNESQMSAKEFCSRCKTYGVYYVYKRRNDYV